MDNNMLIGELRDRAKVEGAGSLAALLNAAADRIEEMDERICIVSESLDAVMQKLAEVSGNSAE